jgi:hypothetical protein
MRPPTVFAEVLEAAEQLDADAQAETGSYEKRAGSLGRLVGVHFWTFARFPERVPSPGFVPAG